MTDERLIQIVDAALADAARRAGSDLACRPGCAQCCIGPFAIHALDAERLRRGYRELAERDAPRHGRVRQRVESFAARMFAEFPGDPRTGVLDESESGQARFAEFADDEPCPALDPESATCDLYGHRPMTCRTFGPPVRGLHATPGEEGNGLCVCELCFVGASPERVAACEMVADPDGLEDDLLRERWSAGADAGSTIVAYALLGALEAPGEGMRE